MSLKNCGACGRLVSVSAKACPQCGHPTDAPPEKYAVRAASAAFRLGQLAVLAVVIVGLVVFAFFAWADMHGLLDPPPIKPIGQ